ncbi:TPA: hypothetical protein QDB08_003625 [Burkholderia vietnamiensis]|nr:hypothetical protein [Burkholderia vietnamiensis]MBR8087639.1 hypothetical protein [Burkholderia vietnamiensis]MDN7819693.1 hypothetical protein [Burkholderia vietnamiensis]HDR9010638.1 hypothetical protein [Burkholderia vietnamiensis]HDR9019035.1 hypothetical protein [Burkholderia vietnamiensis]
MALELARALAASERDDNLHMARLLLLMRYGSNLSPQRSQLLTIERTLRC